VSEPTLKQKLRSGRSTVGGWVTLGHPAIGEILAAAGFDFVVIDLEHSVITLERAAELIRAIESRAVAPLVRLTSNDANLAKRVMDAGAHGIIVPSVNSVEDARHAVQIVRYGPQGVRGVGLGRAQGYGARFKEYFAWQLQQPVVVVQIEHVAALAVLTDILRVPGVDAFLIGPYDLSCSLGHPGEFEHPDFVRAIAAIREAGKATGVPGGVHVVEPDLGSLRRALDDGYHFIAYGVDIRFLDVAARAAMNLVREIR
jgi:2-keto-3-deoxy-L-rhamnonate aldolase RhmA